jgi:hypothetical protein
MAEWDLGLGRAVFTRLTAALDTGELRLPQAPGVPAEGSISGPFVVDDSQDDELMAVVTRTPGGECVFFDRRGGRLCAIHSQLGEAWLPPACRHFPRTYLIEEDRVLVTLSHVCPSAAALLFRTDVGRIATVVSPAMCEGHGDPEGFDARGTVPPFVRPGVVFDRASQESWETFVLSACSRSAETAEQTILRLAQGAGVVRDWTVGHGPMAGHVRDRLNGVVDVPAPAARVDLSRVITMYAMVGATVPAGLSQPELPDFPEEFDTLWVAPGWGAGCSPLPGRPRVCRMERVSR